MSDRAEDILAVYDDHMEEIYAYCLRRLRVPQLAQDAASATFLRLVEEYESIGSKDRAMIRGWLYGAASNAVAFHFRHENRLRRYQHELAQLAEERCTTQDAANGYLDWPILHEAICGLKQQYQEIVVLRYFQGLTVAEIASALNMRQVTVRVYLSRAVSQLRHELEHSFGDGFKTT